MTNEQWLMTPGFKRTVLVEVDYSVSGKPATLYLANRAYCTGPNEYPPNQPYDDWITSFSEFSSELSETIYGQTQLYDFDVTCRFTDWLYELVMKSDFNDHSVRVYVGDHTWPRDSFVLYAQGRGQGFSPTSSQSIVLSVADRQREFTSVVSLTRSEDEIELPRLFGQCYNIAPIQIDLINRVYSVNDGIATVSVVRENGAPIPFTDNGDGTFTLANNAKGKITCDAKSPHLNAAAVVVDLFPGSDVVMPDILIGLYINKQISGVDLLDKICVSTGCFWRPNQPGVYIRSSQISSAPAATFTADMIEPHSLTPSQWLEPAARVSIGYKRNYSPLREAELAGVVIEKTPDLIPDLTNEYSYQNIDMSGSREINIDTLLVNEVDALALRDNRSLQVSTRKAIYSFETLAVPFGIQPGDTVFLEKSVFFDQCNALLVAKHGNLGTDKTTLEVLV